MPNNSSIINKISIFISFRMYFKFTNTNNSFKNSVILEFRVLGIILNNFTIF